jgi:hypothetical protein
VRRLLATGAVAAAVVAAVTAGSVSARPGGLAVHKPTAAISFGAEVAVKGKYFKPREKVTVTLTSATISGHWTRKATATKTGTFSASFGHIALSSCNQYTLKVVGSLKSKFTTSHDVVPC